VVGCRERWLRENEEAGSSRTRLYSGAGFVLGIPLALLRIAHSSCTGSGGTLHALLQHEGTGAVLAMHGGAACSAEMIG
jgi:hypothetical protein